MLIMTFVTKSFASVSDVATRVAAQGIAGVTSFAKAVVNRREIMQLAELDERGLKDIGLIRSDVEGALASSWLSDPSAVLAARAGSASSAASARRDEGGRQAQAKAEASRERPSTPTNDHVVACSA